MCHHAGVTAAARQLGAAGTSAAAAAAGAAAAAAEEAGSADAHNGMFATPVSDVGIASLPQQLGPAAYEPRALFPGLTKPEWCAKAEGKISRVDCWVDEATGIITGVCVGGTLSLCAALVDGGAAVPAVSSPALSRDARPSPALSRNTRHAPPPQHTHRRAVDGRHGHAPAGHVRHARPALVRRHDRRDGVHCGDQGLQVRLFACLCVGWCGALQQCSCWCRLARGGRAHRVSAQVACAHT
jgi:hypothetical protein